MLALSLVLGACEGSERPPVSPPTEAPAVETEAQPLPGPPPCTAADLLPANLSVLDAEEGSSATLGARWTSHTWWQIDARIDRHARLDAQYAGWSTPAVVHASLVLPYDVGVRKAGRRQPEDIEVRFQAARGLTDGAHALFPDLPEAGEIWACRVEGSRDWSCTVDGETAARPWPVWLPLPTALPAGWSSETFTSSPTVLEGHPTGLTHAGSRGTEVEWALVGTTANDDDAVVHVVGHFQGRGSVNVGDDAVAAEQTGVAVLGWRTGVSWPESVSGCWTSTARGSRPTPDGAVPWTRVETTRVDLLVRPSVLPRIALAAAE